MSIFNIRRTLRSSQRLATILSVLARHGFGHLAVRLRLGRFLPFRQRFRRLQTETVEADNPRLMAERLVRVLEDLGPTFVKLGQSLASRPDLLSPDFQGPLRKLHDRVRPFEFEEARQMIERDLGARLETLFSDVEKEPLACGSIGQVHRATTIDGEAVILKIKRPGIERVILNDMSLLRILAALIEKHIPEYRVYQPQLLVDEFSRTIHRELDFISEASITSRFYETFRRNPHISTPRVFWEYCSHNVLTLERLEGRPVSFDMPLDGGGLHRKALADHLLDAFMVQYFELGIFHADPHPGNLLIQPPSGWAILDFGQVGRLDREMRSRLTMILIAATRREIDLAMDILEDLGTVTADVDRAQLKKDLETVLDKYYGTPLKHIHLSSLFEEIVGLARTHKMILPRDFVLLGKSLTNAGGIALLLDPDASPVSYVQPRLRRLVMDQLAPGRLARGAAVSLYGLLSVLKQAPQAARRIMRNLSRGQMRVIFQHDGLTEFINELDRTGNRIAFSLITGSMILGSAMLMNARIQPLIGEVSVLGLAGFILAGICGLWLLYSIFRSGRL